MFTKTNEAAPTDRPDTSIRDCSEDESRRELGVYGGIRAVRCDDCGEISPTSDHLIVHRLRKCGGGPLARWAA